MKKLFLLSAAAVTLAAVLLSVSVSNKNSSATNDGSSVTQVVESREPLYVMKTTKGKIGVFKPNEEQPMYTLEDVHVKSLPQYDQSLLKTGIKVYSERELQSLIEDYDS